MGPVIGSPDLQAAFATSQQGFHFRELGKPGLRGSIAVLCAWLAAIDHDLMGDPREEAS